jgi:hypothetical protein
MWFQLEPLDEISAGQHGVLISMGCAGDVPHAGVAGQDHPVGFEGLFKRIIILQPPSQFPLLINGR